MQDKELDELFRSKLDSFEAEPSANTWPGIAAGINAGGQKKTVVPMLGIAASIIVLVGIAVLFIPKKAPVNVNGPAKHTFAKTVRPTVKPATVTNTPGPVQLASVNTPRVKHSPVVRSAYVRSVNGEAKPVDTTAQNKIAGNPADQTLITATVQKQEGLIKAVVPDAGTQLTTKLSTDEPAFIAKPVLLTGQLPPVKTDATPVKIKHRIHSLGDLINTVVAKVDKRQDKFIVFSDDDGDSNITGVNLGIIKIKKGD